MGSTSSRYFLTLKKFWKILLYVVVSIIGLIVILVVSVYLFKDKIIRQFIEEANKSLNTPVKVEKIDVSVFERFPQLSIVLTDVYVEDSHPGEYPLLTAKSISFQLDPIEVWKGRYTINGLQIRESETNLKINDKGTTNYDIIKKGNAKSDNTGVITFALSDVGLKKTRVHYFDLNSRQDLVFTSEALTASIQSTNDIYTIDADGELTTEKISIEGRSYLEGKWFMIRSQLVYNDAERNLLIKPSELDLKGNIFSVSGNYSWKTKNLIDITTEGKDTDVQTVLSLLPESVSERFGKYKSKGDVYFTARLRGEISKRGNPSFSVEFGCRNATIFHPETKAEIEEASLEGSFASSDVTDARQAVLVLKNITGKLNDELFTANFVLQDFDKPEVICDFKGIIDAAALSEFYPVEYVRNVSGSLQADISFEGKIEFLKKKATAQRVSTTGTIEMDAINFTYGSDQVAVKNLKGTLQFNNNDLALSNVSGELGNSDFLLNGFFKNVITFLLFEDQPIGIETDLQSNFIDLDQLFAISFGDAKDGAKQAYAFSISRNINLNFNCDVRSLKYKRFHGHQLKGDLLVKNEMAVSRNITVKSMGGDLTLSGIVDAKNQKAIDVVSSFRLNGIHVDSVFYVFENFQQDFIEDKHLKGNVFADVNLEMVLKPDLHLFPETLIADVSMVIKNGELNNFEPMQKLNKYVRDDEGLNKLRFSDIKNDIHIENKTVYIPQMEVRTNITSLQISGTHTFDQRIEYRIITPLRRQNTLDQEAQQAIGQENGQSKLYLKLTGTTDNYRVVYDTESVKKKIISDLKNEVKELKDAFKNKGTQKKKELELEKEEYFEWDENPQR